MSEDREQLPGLPRLLAHQLVYQTRVLLRSPRAVVGGILLPLLMLALRGGRQEAHSADAVARLAVLGLLSSAYITHTSGLVAARQAGVLKRWHATPLPAWCYFSARIGATVLMAAASAAITIIAAAAFFGGVLTAAAVPGTAAALVAGAATWASIGTALTILIPTVEAAWPLLGLTYLPLVVLSGSFGSVSGAPTWLASLVTYLPVDPIIDATTRALRGIAPFTARDLLVLAAWAGAGLAMAQRGFRWDPRRTGLPAARSAPSNPTPQHS